MPEAVRDPKWAPQFSLEASVHLVISAFNCTSDWPTMTFVRVVYHHKEPGPEETLGSSVKVTCNICPIGL